MRPVQAQGAAQPVAALRVAAEVGHLHTENAELQPYAGALQLAFSQPKARRLWAQDDLGATPQAAGVQAPNLSELVAGALLLRRPAGVAPG